MTTLIIRVLIIYLLILIVFRLMGKRQIAQMQPFEFVLTLIIADLAVIPMAEIALPILNGVVPLLTLVVIHFCITVATRKSKMFSKLLSGKPVIIVTPSGIDYSALKKLNITLEDLFESIRTAGFFSISEVQYAIMETNGKVSVMPKVSSAPVTSLDLKIQKDEFSLPLAIIEEGKFMEENLKLSQKNKEFYENIIKKQGISSIKSVLLLTITKQGEVFVQPKQGPCKIIDVE